MKAMAVLLMALAFDAFGQDAPFPQRGPIEITVLFPAGSSADVTARMLADGIAKQLNQRVLVMNRPGAGGAIRYKHVPRQKPDGHSLVWNSNSISTTHNSGHLDNDYPDSHPVARVLAQCPLWAVPRDPTGKGLNE